MFKEIWVWLTLMPNDFYDVTRVNETRIARMNAHSREGEGLANESARNN